MTLRFLSPVCLLPLALRLRGVRGVRGPHGLRAVSALVPAREPALPRAAARRDGRKDGRHWSSGSTMSAAAPTAGRGADGAGAAAQQQQQQPQQQQRRRRRQRQRQAVQTPPPSTTAAAAAAAGGGARGEPGGGEAGGGERGSDADLGDADFVVLPARGDGALPLALVDGASLEGGGQILRNCVALSALLGRPVEVRHVRARRAKPGLRPQHLTGLQLLARMHGAVLEGGTVGSTTVRFLPASPSRVLLPPDGGRPTFEADTTTAGSVALLLQAALVPCVLAARPVELVCRGGTNAAQAPQIDYVTRVFAPLARLFGVEFEVPVLRRGFYPRGGGEVRIVTRPVRTLRAVTLVDRGEIAEIRMHAFVTNLPAHIADRMAAAATARIRAAFPQATLHTGARDESDRATLGGGCGILAVATTTTGCIVAGSGLGERGKPAERVGDECAVMLIENLRAGGCVDEFAQDQLIILMALAHGRSTIRTGPLTLHTRTTIHFSACLTGAAFDIREESDGTRIVSCEGIGFTPTAEGTQDLGGAASS